MPLAKLPSIFLVWIVALLLSFGSASFLSPAHAAQSEAFSNVALTARLMSAEDGVAPDASTLSLGLALEFGDGWKGYWRSAGEVGLPPKIDWSGSKNLRSAEILWPAPQRFEAFGIENFGYIGSVVLPISIALETPGEAVELRARASVLTCSDVCVPNDFDLMLDLSEGSGIDRASASEIAAYVARVPASPEESDIRILSAAVDERSSALFVTAQSERAFQNADLFPEFGDYVAFGKPDIRLSNGNRDLWARIPINTWAQDHEPPQITLTDKGRGVTSPITLSSDIPEPPFTIARQGTDPVKLLTIAAIAILGGLILNVMPCVLPVLSIKLSSVLKAERQSRAAIRNGFLFSALGILCFVWALAAVLIAIRAAGLSVGWGVQFQNPAFVALMFIVVAVFAANLFGAFEISLPEGLQSRMGANGARTGYVADFGTGFLAAILATPCSAPFLGTAIAFALAGSPVDILVIFTSLGIGLALPYLAVAAKPGLVNRLPRAGRWMIWVKVLLGLLLLGTAGWLFFVLNGVAGWQVAGLVLGSAVLLVLVAMSRSLGTALRRTLAPALFLLPVFGAGFLTPVSAPAAVGPSANWVAFDAREIPRHVAAGRTVFVDVTADWCLTCKANKTLVLDRSPVSERLNAENVVAMQADWTRPSEEISRFLERNGRFGIPFNIVYGPGAASGIALPEVLTPQSVMDALETASTRSLASK